jgi:SOS response regulatory protein OraA/RecX
MATMPDRIWVDGGSSQMWADQWISDATEYFREDHRDDTRWISDLDLITALTRRGYDMEAVRQVWMNRNIGG